MNMRLLLSIGLLVLPVMARAQELSINHQRISSGGGRVSGGDFTLTGTVGQADAGPRLAGGDYTLTAGFWSSYIALRTPGAPMLTITRVGNNVEISWPVAGSTGFVLEETTSLTSPIPWNATGTAPTLVDDRHVLSFPSQPGNHFFRLKLPVPP